MDSNSGSHHDDISDALNGLLLPSDSSPLGQTTRTSAWSAGAPASRVDHLQSYSSHQSPPATFASPPSHSTPIPRPRPGQQRRMPSIGNVSAHAQGDQPPPATQFDPPPRSIFASGPPTASVSANTAHASLSAAASSGSGRPFAALTNASVGRRSTFRTSEIAGAASPTGSRATYPLQIPEKGVDDPFASIVVGGAEHAQGNASTNLSDLFVSSERGFPGPLSRGDSYFRSMSNTNRIMHDTSTLTGHLFHNGFTEGRHSDITVHAFGQSYKLHKLLLDRVPFFSSAFSGSWAESSAKEITLLPEETDSNITQAAFELALKRIYGTTMPAQEDQEAIGLFATACWLDMPDLVDSCVDSILRQMHPSRLHLLIRLVTSNFYGKAGDRILSSAKAMLCREGWEMPYEYWDYIPADIIREMIGGDPFYIPGEWERWFLSLKLLNRRLKALATQAGLVSPDGRYILTKPTSLRYHAVRSDTTRRRDQGMGGNRQTLERDDAWVSLYMSPEVTPLLVLLDEGINYVHLRFEQLQQIRSQKDVLGVPILPEKVISDALWMAMELRQRVLNASEGDLELGLSDVADDYDETIDMQPARPSSACRGKQREGASPDSIESVTEHGSWDGNGQPRKFWIPSNDVSCVMGGSREACVAANSTSTADWTTHAARLSASLEPADVAWAVDFTGAMTDNAPGVSARGPSSLSAPRYSQYPPFRFSAEFPNPRTLKEKKRVYSQTVWYAGSMWNLYIQRVNTSKNQQLGIYLHRAKDKDPSDDPLAQFIPATVDDRIGQLEREMLLRKSERRNRQWRADVMTSGGEADREDESSGGSSQEYEVVKPAEGGVAGRASSSMPSLVRRSGGPATALKTSQTPNLPVSRPKSPPPADGSRMLDSDDENDEFVYANRKYSVAAMPPYIDNRPTIKTYFKIYSPSRAGRLLSIYESAPDRFNFSQSWGWKSSQMVLDDGIGGYEMTKGVKDGKLRYMAVIGNV